MPHRPRLLAARGAGLVLLAALGACASSARLEPARSGAESAAPPRYFVTQPDLLPDELTIPLEIRGVRPFVATAVNGRPAGGFLLDTGATCVAIDEDLADDLRLPLVAPTRIGGIVATETGSIRGLDALAVGDLQLDGDVAVVLPLGAGGAGEPNQRGIFGVAALGAGPFTIDLERARLTVYNPGRFQPPANAARQVLRLESGLPYVAATLEGDETVWLMLDTGAAASVVLWRPFVQAHPNVLTVPQKRWALASGAGGGNVVMISEVQTLRIFGREFQNVTTAIQDRPSWMWQHPRAVGIVGAEILRNFRVTMRPESHLIWTEPL